MRTAMAIDIQNSDLERLPQIENITMTTEQLARLHFNFDRGFQEKIVQAMIIDRKWASQFAEVVDVDYFEFGFLKKISNTYINYYLKYKEFPSLELLATISAGELKNPADEGIRGQVHDFLVRVSQNRDLGDLGYVKEKSLEFCKKAGLQKALDQSVDLIQTEKYEKVVEIIKKAISAGNEHSPGLDLMSDVEARYSETFRRTVPTGIPELDQRKVLNGGLGAGELGVVIAPTGVGKSHFLVHVGAQALLQGKNVLHYTFELNERAVGIRYDSHLLEIDSIECHEHKQYIKEYYEKNAETLGRLRIKYYPTGGATVNTLRSHIDKLAVEGFIPDLLIVDYAGIMRSTEKYELLRLELKKIYEELRSFANELDVPTWTATQSNKEGADKDYVDLTNMAEAYGQAHVADFVLGLSRKALNKSTGYGNVFVAKNRAGVDGIQYQIHLDAARSKLRVLSENEISSIQQDSMEMAENSSAASLIRQKIRQFQKNG
ncbi:MAG: DnaB-like helicase C-terminal domain-containing protein [Candidatus Paceibacterota bacterium]|jgi:replicative DNA helicase